MECSRQNFFVFLGSFLLFYPTNNPQKWKFWKNEKIAWRYDHFTQVYHKWQSYEVWFLRYEAWRTEFFVILDCFLPFYPHNKMKNQNVEKLKKTPGDIIILHKCTPNHDNMLYYSLDMACNRFNCFSFWAIFALLPP